MRLKKFAAAGLAAVLALSMAGCARLLDLPAEGFQPIGPASRGDDVVTQCGEPQRGRPADAGCSACDDSLFFHKRLSSIPEQK